jgi:homeobox-leucine zipper protein
LLPSDFSILLDGHSNNNTIAGSSSDGSGIGGNSGYFLAVGIQMLLNGLQTSKLTTESVDTINELISCTIKILEDQGRFWSCLMKNSMHDMLKSA